MTTREALLQLLATPKPLSAKRDAIYTELAQISWEDIEARPAWDLCSIRGLHDALMVLAGETGEEDRECALMAAEVAKFVYEWFGGDAFARTSPDEDGEGYYQLHSTRCALIAE